MDTADGQRKRVRDQFSATRLAYVTSRAHASGADLSQLVAWAEGGPGTSLLDIATGGGHAALALSSIYERVVATDLTPPMLDAARAFVQGQGAANVSFELADAEALPFASDSFDAVSCRIAAHHFPDPGHFVREAARVLKADGLFLFEDSIVPDEPRLAASLNTIERLRDPSHQRSLTRTEWVESVERAGLLIEARSIDSMRHDLTDWMDRSRTPAGKRQEIDYAFRDTGQAGIEAFHIEFTPDGTVVSFADEKLLLKARKPKTA